MKGKGMAATSLRNSGSLPVTAQTHIVLAHGSGGRMSADLLRRLFLPRFENPYLNRLDDQAVVKVGGQQIAFPTDSFVVRPLFVAGDTKVVDKGSGDQCFINPSGIGLLEHAWLLSAIQARPGDVVLLSGTIG